MKHTLFCDASFNPHNKAWANAEVVTGKICISDGKGYEVVEEVVIGKIEGLRQYNNVLELTAIARAVELAIEKGLTGGLTVKTDSQTAAAWSYSGIRNPKVRTVAHENALNYLNAVRKKYGEVVFVGTVPRASNPAGHTLEALLK